MKTPFPITRLSALGCPGVHTYFDVRPDSPDGKHIVHFAYTGPIDAGRGDGKLCITRADGRNPQLLTDPIHAHTQNGIFQQWLSPHEIAYRRLQDNKPETATIDIRTGKKRYFPDMAIRMASPDGTKALCHIGPDTPGTSQRAKSMRAVFLLDFIAETGRKLFCIEDAWALHPLRNQCHPQENRLYFKHTKWAADGSTFMVVFTNERAEPGEDKVKSIFLADADGGNLRYLTEFTTHPFWHINSTDVCALMTSPDGLILTAYPIDGGEPRELSEPFRGCHVDMHPSGHYLIADSFAAPWAGKGEGAIFLYDLRTHKQSLVARFPLPDNTNATGCHPHPVFSRDGKKVFFNATENGYPIFCQAELPF